MSIALFLLAITGIICAKISKLVRLKQANPLLLLITTSLSTLVWMWMARYGKTSLVYASVVYDVVYAGTYFAALVFFGDRPQTIQYIGAALAISGVALMGLGE